MTTTDRTKEALEDRLLRLRSFGVLRRALREADEIDAVGAVTVRFVVTQLECRACAVYCADGDTADLRLLAASGETGVPETIAGTSPLVTELATHAVVRSRDELRNFAELVREDAVAVALRSQPDKLVGIIVLPATLDDEVLEELAFDVESALTARLIAKLRAEELAVLEIQERELVGLLRDVQERDAIIQKDLEEAQQFQRSMLGAPPRVSGASIEIVYRPLGVVGGDLYAVSIDGDRLRLFVADATGHGVRASLTTMFIKSGYEAVRHGASDPAALLEALNNNIARTYRSSEMLFSAACVDFDLRTGKVRFASAANPAVCFVRAGVAELVEGGGAFLGLKAKMRFETRETTLATGDGVYLFTDGFLEARRADGDQFGDARLRDTVLRAHAADAAAGAALAEATAAFAGGQGLDDDATFIGVRYGAEDPIPSSRIIDSGPP